MHWVHVVNKVRISEEWIQTQTQRWSDSPHRRQSRVQMQTAQTDGLLTIDGVREGHVEQINEISEKQETKSR